MERKRQIADERVICIVTNARCTKPKIGLLLGRYLRNEVSPEQKLAFEQHMSECIACDSTVLNWQNLKFAASAHRGATKAWKDPTPKAGS